MALYIRERLPLLPSTTASTPCGLIVQLADLSGCVNAQEIAPEIFIAGLNSGT